MAEPTMIEKIALAVKKGMEIREDSWCSHMDRYNKDIRESLIEATKLFDLDVRFAELLDLACYWWNDVEMWADDILGLLSPEAPMSTHEQGWMPENKG